MAYLAPRHRRPEDQWIQRIVTDSRPKAWPEDQWIQRIVTDSRPKDWTITSAQPVLDFITKVHEGKWAEIVWLTTWQHDANKVADALFLPHFPHIDNPMWQRERYAGPRWWKLAEVTRELASGRPIIWTDDDISSEILTLFRKAQGELDAPASLVLCPNTNEGLAPRHLAKIAEFLGMPREQ